MFAVALIAGKKAGKRSPSKIILIGFVLLSIGVGILIPIVPHADTGWDLFGPLLVAGAGLGLLVSQLNNYTLAPIEEERVSEAAGVNSAGGSFGLSFGLAFAGAIMLASLSLIFTNEANSSAVLSPVEQDRVAAGLEENAEVMTNAHLESLLVGQPDDVKAEIVRINTEARPIALQIALDRAPGRRAPRPHQRLPDDSPSRSQAVRGSRSDTGRLSRALCRARHGALG